MTNELEKQFFDTFGVEPKPIYSGSKLYNPFVTGYDYPTITDRILLKLLCLCPDLDNVFFTDVEKLKETLLNSYINIYNYYVNAEWLSDCEKELKHQVRTLFEEG